MDELLSQVKEGDRRALARAITYIENQGEKGRKLLDLLNFQQQGSHVIGITGSPGSGKSTLVDKIIHQYRKENYTVGVLAIDPTSPFTGGSILGDRIRMLATTEDEGVYIRSLASRGRLGGLSPHTFDVLHLMRAAGFDKIIVETVGAGQSEIDIVRNVDTTIVVTVPGLGDDIQVIKAGIMEIADIFAVNKADLSGAPGLALQIKNMLNLVPNKSSSKPEVLQTVALTGQGIEDLIHAIDNHFDFLLQSGNMSVQRRDQLRFDIINKVQYEISTILKNPQNESLEYIIDQLFGGHMVLSSAVEYLKGIVFTSKPNN